MEQNLITDIEPSAEYLSGFNNAFVVGDYDEDLLRDVVGFDGPEDDFSKGFFDGRTQALGELDRAHVQELDALRHRGDRARDVELE